MLENVIINFFGDKVGRGGRIPRESGSNNGLKAEGREFRVELKKKL